MSDAYTNANNHLVTCACSRCNEPESLWASELMRTGGPWLGAARSRLQHHPGGDRVTWGSADKMTLTVAQIEEVAAHAAAAAHNEAIKQARGFYTSPVGRASLEGQS